MGSCRTLYNLMYYTGISSSSTNTNSYYWQNGHGSLGLVSRTSSSFFNSNYAKIAQGDGSSGDPADWVVFGFNAAGGGSNWDGKPAIGCENAWNACGAPSGTIKI